MEIIRPLAQRMARSSRSHHIIESIKYGWDSYNFLFYIGTVSAILSGVFGIAGGGAAAITIFLFYLAGRFKREVDLERERISKRRTNK